MNRQLLEEQNALARSSSGSSCKFLRLRNKGAAAAASNANVPKQPLEPEVRPGVNNSQPFSTLTNLQPTKSLRSPTRGSAVNSSSTTLPGSTAWQSIPTSARNVAPQDRPHNLTENFNNNQHHQQQQQVQESASVRASMDSLAISRSTASSVGGTGDWREQVAASQKSLDSMHQEPMMQHASQPVARPAATSSSSHRAIPHQQQMQQPRFDDQPAIAASRQAPQYQPEQPSARSGSSGPVVEVDSMVLPQPGHREPDFARANAFTSEDGQAVAAQDAPVSLVECSKCGRKFAHDRVAKHETICNPNKKVKVYNAKERRLSMLSKDELAAADAHGEAIEAKLKNRPKNTWRKQSAQLQNALGAAAGGAAPAAVEEVDDRVECRGCGRKFGATAHERHEPKCLEKLRLGRR